MQHDDADEVCYLNSENKSCNLKVNLDNAVSDIMSVNHLITGNIYGTDDVNMILPK